MHRTRRQFLTRTLTQGALLGSALGSFGPASLAGLTRDGEGPRERRRILILGGTGFLGPALITAVLERGHELTLFNSGTTEARREASGRDSVVPEGVEVLLGNRDPELTADDRRLRGLSEEERAEQADPDSPKGLTTLEGREWDAVIDTSGYWPRIVRASAELLAPRVKQYVFISSISVYASSAEVGQDEGGELLSLEDPTSEDFGPSFENYGGGKAMCEAAAEAAMPGRVTNVRPGFIVGPRDTSRRYGYWPWRIARGGEVLVPGSAADPVQLIDVRDLAEWIVRCVEAGHVGPYNATGPVPAMTWGEMLTACAEGTGAEADFCFADAGFLAERGLGYPIWVPPSGETAGFHRVDVSRAVAAGLTFRPHAETARDTLAWMRGLGDETASRLVPAPLLEGEAEALAAWKAREDEEADEG
jgi:2'-hydroxyisoflavone reductase